jgi:hypothetical protein
MRRGPLRETSFALLFAGRAFSSLGDRLVPVALAFARLFVVRDPYRHGLPATDPRRYGSLARTQV